MRIDSNLRGVCLELIDSLYGDPNHDEMVLREVGHDIVAMVQTRIQQRGQGVDGTLNTKATNRLGAYSKGYGRHRDRKGRQTKLVDLTMDGDLFRAWQVVSSNRREVTVGFIEEKAGQIAEYLEVYYGDIFGLSDEEQRLVIEDLMKLT